MNIYEKISKIMDNVKALSKDTEVGYNGKTQYRAISENKVTKVLREQMIKYGLVVYPIEQTYSRTGNLTSVSVKYRMVNVEDKSEYIDIVSSGEGADTQDKGAGKAMTYAYKYMLLRTFAIPTGEDANFIHSDTLTDIQKAVNEANPKPEKVSRAKKTADPIPMVSKRHIDWIKGATQKHDVAAQVYLDYLGSHNIPNAEALTLNQANELIDKIVRAVEAENTKKAEAEAEEIFK